MNVILTSFCDGLYAYPYKNKIWYFEFSEMFGPAKIDPKTYEITEECIPTSEVYFWEMFEEWFRLSKERKEEYRIK